MRFSQQNAIGHQLDIRCFRHLVGKADLVADMATELALELLCNPCGGGPCGNTPGLGMTNQAMAAATELKTNFWELRCLTGSGFATDDHHLIVANGGGNIGPLLVDR